MGEQDQWRNATIVKTIDADCQAAWITKVVENAARDCLSTCSSLDRTSQCYMKCFFDAILGTDSDKTIIQHGGLGRDALISAWAAGFESENQAIGGCLDINASPALVIV